MNSVIELHDSVIADFTTIGSQVVVLFNRVYIHQSEGRPGLDPGTGWVQAAALTFTSASLVGEFPETPADVWDGSLTVDGELLPNTIPIPFEHTGDVLLQVHLCGDTRVTVRGAGAALTLIGEPAYVEQFAGSDT